MALQSLQIIRTIAGGDNATELNFRNHDHDPIDRSGDRGDRHQIIECEIRPHEHHDHGDHNNDGRRDHTPDRNAALVQTAQIRGRIALLRQ